MIFFFIHSSWALLTSKSERCHISGTWKRSIFISYTWVLHNVTWFCPFLTCHRKPPSGSCSVPCREADGDMMKLTVTFSVASLSVSESSGRWKWNVISSQPSHTQREPQSAHSLRFKMPMSPHVVMNNKHSNCGCLNSYLLRSSPEHLIPMLRLLDSLDILMPYFFLLYINKCLLYWVMSSFLLKKSRESWQKEGSQKPMNPVTIRYKDWKEKDRQWKLLWVS